MPAGLPNTVAASLALAARPADAVPRSGVPISYSQNPAASAGDTDSVAPAQSAAPQMSRAINDERGAVRTGPSFQVSDFRSDYSLAFLLSIAA
jgi:hypothetical protein